MITEFTVKYNNYSLFISEAISLFNIHLETLDGGNE